MTSSFLYWKTIFNLIEFILFSTLLLVKAQTRCQLKITVLNEMASNGLNKELLQREKMTNFLLQKPRLWRHFEAGVEPGNHCQVLLYFRFYSRKSGKNRIFFAFWRTSLPGPTIASRRQRNEMRTQTKAYLNAPTSVR